MLKELLDGVALARGGGKLRCVVTKDLLAEKQQQSSKWKQGGRSSGRRCV